MEINITELKTTADKLFAHLLQTGHVTVSIDHDYYWDIPSHDRYNPYVEPLNLSMGQLTDDIHELKRIHDGSTEPMSFALVWLSAVLREIGEKVVV